MLVKYSAWENAYNQTKNINNKIMLLSQLESKVVKGQINIDKKVNVEKESSSIVQVILKKNK